MDRISLPPVEAPGSGTKTTSSEMKDAAETFETVFLAQVLNAMGTGLNGEFGLGAGDDSPFGSMLQQEYARLISRSGGVGIADAVLREMLMMQEAQ